MLPTINRVQLTLADSIKSLWVGSNIIAGEINAVAKNAFFLFSLVWKILI